MSIRVIGPGEPSTMYHWETEQENFPVLSGEALLIVETNHAFVGAGDAPCVLLCAGSRQFQKEGPWGKYTVDDAARPHGACGPEDTQDGSVA
jgi:hypothetical protein